MNLLFKKEFAKMVGVSTNTVSKAIRERLGAIMVGNKVDADHPDAVAYVDEWQQIKARGLRQPPQKVVPAGPPKPRPPGDKHRAPTPQEKEEKPEIDKVNRPLAQMLGGNLSNEELNSFGSMELRTLLDRYGTDRRFAELLKALKTVEEINEKRLKNAEREGNLIPRDMVKAVVFALLDSCFVQILDDGSRTITSRTITAVEAGESAEDIEEMVRGIQSIKLRSVKDRITRSLGGD